MKPMYKPNISATGRFVSTVAGATLATIGYRRKNRMLSALGLGLVGRGASGWCPVTAAVHSNGGRAEDETRRHLSGSGGVLLEDALTIYRPIDEVYKYWRNLENLPQFMEHLEDVRMLDSARSRWVAIGPLGVRVAWDAEIINDIPPTLISWKSVGESDDVVSAGSVRFKSIGEQATELYVRLQYDPPAGRVGATVAWLLGDDPQRQIAADLRRFKQILEQGDLMAGYRSSTTSPRTERGIDDSELSPDLGSLR